MVSFCELCGKQTEIKKKVMIEKTVFNVCLACSKRGKAIESNGTVKQQTTTGKNVFGLEKSLFPSNSLTKTFVKKTKTPPIIKPLPQKKINLIDETTLNPDFPSIIREARTKKGLTHEQMGQKLNEKVTLLRKIETGSIKPDEILSKKIERFLGIKLYINPNEEINE